MMPRASEALICLAASAEGTVNTTPALSRFMLSAMKALGLPLNSETSIWSREMPGRCARLATALKESPRRTLYSSPDSAACGAAVTGRAAAGLGAAGARMGAGADGRAIGALLAMGGGGGGDGDAEGDGKGAGVATAEVTGAGAAATREAGGSNNIVYSRTRRPEAQVASRITSTKGSSTARSLDTRTKARPSGRRSTVTTAEGSTGLYSTPAAR